MALMSMFKLNKLLIYTNGYAYSLEIIIGSGSIDLLQWI
jgi:hypothetical protein